MYIRDDFGLGEAERMHAAFPRYQVIAVQKSYLGSEPNDFQRRKMSLSTKILRLLFSLRGFLESLLQPTWRYLTVTLSDHVNYQEDVKVNHKIHIDNYDDVDDFFLYQDVIWG